MKKVLFIAVVLLVSVVFLVPTYAGKKPKKMEIVNDVVSLYHEYDGGDPPHVLMTVAENKTFVLTDIIEMTGDSTYFDIFENETLKFSIHFYEGTYYERKAVNMNSGISFAAGSTISLRAPGGSAGILFSGYMIENWWD